MSDPVASPIRLDGRAALVTGAANGLGRAMAHAMWQAGARVAFADVDEPALAAACGELEARRPGSTLVLRCDITRRSDCEAAVAAVQDRFSALHVLVNNAGRGPRHVGSAPETTSMRFWETDPASWRLVIETNVVGTYLMSRAAAPLLIASGSGRIVNVTTSLSTMQRGANTPYGPSKAAIEAETLIFAKDLEGTGVTCNSLVPGGAADTAFVSPESRAAAERDGRPLISPQVMAEPIVWLASRLSDGVTGRRYVGKFWDPGLPWREASQRALEAPVLREPTDGRN
jgi:NAD(P)-dependent dehydrogenase (short-subunit alcohol dehydrogenase family)